ncbi:hypothetical protein B0H34DRAFT_802410 [Crassisporium funariophilum]|nr:hypothetical protein B0H34DRAFT_802410 [Crassisporium funariophilum]
MVNATLRLRWLQIKIAWCTTRRAVATISRKPASAIKRRTKSAKKKAARLGAAASEATKDKLLLSLPGTSEFTLPDSPCPHILLSNKPPSNSEAILIRQVISEAYLVLCRLQVSLQEEPSRGLDTVKKHKLGRARRFIRDHKAVLSPIRRIPPELIEYIFILAYNRWNYPRRAHPPWALSQVSHSWRSIALSVSALWSSIPMIFLKKRVSPSYLKGFKDLLARSRDAPINFYIYAPGKAYPSHPIIDALVCHSERWKSVAIDSTSTTVLAFHGAKGRLATLHSLILEISEVWRYPGDTLIDIFEVAAKLKEVRVNGPYPATVKLPFSQLTSYKECLRGRGVTEQAIETGMSLTTLELARYGESIPLPKVTLDSLTTLKVQFDGAPAEQSLLENLTLPAINEMQFTGCSFTGCSEHLIPLLTSMINRSRVPCMLRKFSFRTMFLESGDLTTFLRCVPYLAELNMPIPPLEDLKNLIYEEGEPPLVPCLENLTMACDAIRKEETGRILHAIATTRCELEDNDAYSALPLGVCRRLRSLRLTFASTSACAYEHRFLENWVPSDLSAFLIKQQDRLLDELPELSRQPVPRRRKFDLQWSDRVAGIFPAIENVDIENVNDIFISGLHTTLHHLTRQSGDAYRGFHARTGQILDKWRPILQKGLQDRRWFVKGELSIVYVPINDEIRSSPPEALDILHGMKDDMRFPDLCWPLYMLYLY